ncbi:pilus assembly protein TadG-related protein [Aurantimonas sp. VKM B-3413]|uniref:TadE/TadG family type IV pilus assembly protein n=1 Tax=Aurantimonas sp. VKM B-3413 TaxID=2779401 RepID=UPI001E5E81C6|nr:pilus assembly protein TadG-related protein [Aurantimonas sp. VKM B-3413]MCB8840833.1 pilus assembly protein TadG-related protein [Aurantimonas sp. VKM B-3413]
MAKSALGAALGRFLGDRRGNFGVIAALVAVPLILGMGGAVDYSNALRKRMSVQTAADAAALAAAKYTGNDETERVRQADMLFNANLESDVTIISKQLKINGKSYIYDVKFSSPTAFLGLMAVNDLTMSVEAVSAHSDIPLDIVLVLDSTGSMASSGKMTQMQAAVKLFLGNFDASSGVTNVQVAMVPFDTEVRVNNLNMTMVTAPTVTCSFMSSPDTSYCSSTADGFRIGTQGVYYAGYNNSSRKWIKYLYETTETTDARLVVSRDTYSCAYSSYSSCSVSTATVYNRVYTNIKVTGNWSGCVFDRLQPYDTQNDAPSVSVTATLYPRAANCNSSSSLQPVQGLTTDLTAIQTAVQKLTPSGNTNIAIGVQWGMEALTTSYPLTGANTDARRHAIMIVLTDGDNTQDRWYDSSQSGKIDERTKLACQNAKAMKNPDGTPLEMYTIRLVAGNASLLQDCATDAGHYYSVTAASQLTSVFADIAERVKRIRIVS